MKSDFGAAMRQALDLVRSQDVMEATRVIQRALLDRTGPPPAGEANQDPPRKAPPLLPSPPAPDRVSRPSDAPAAAGAGEAIRRRPTGRKRRPLGEVVALLGQANLPGLARGALGLRKQAPVAVPEGSAWLARSYASPAGARDTKVYVPSGANGRALPLVVMLHGCSQDPDDFAAGTAMNAVAEELGFLVAYPQQPASANRSGCWNWFERAHQTRDAGEPAILAGVARAVMAEFSVDRERVFVAGMSAGGAMAAILAATAPDLFAAAGIHSGLPIGAASDLPSGLMAMRGGSGRANGAKAQAARAPSGDRVRTIVFHGSGDAIVHPSNADAIFSDARGRADGAREEVVEGEAGGRAFTRAIVTDAHGIVQAERWTVEGLGHAWSGGSPDGSFTDARGPDASREMARFFLETNGR